HIPGSSARPQRARASAATIRLSCPTSAHHRLWPPLGIEALLAEKAVDPALETKAHTGAFGRLSRGKAGPIDLRIEVAMEIEAGGRQRPPAMREIEEQLVLDLAHPLVHRLLSARIEEERIMGELY